MPSDDGILIYSGIMVDYELNKNSGLEHITLKQVGRRFLKHDQYSKKSKPPNPNSENENKNIDPYYHIPGHVLVIKYAHVLNLNFSYYKLIRDEKNNVSPVLVE